LRSDGRLVFRAASIEKNRLTFSALAANELLTPLLAVLESAVGTSKAVFPSMEIQEDRPIELWSLDDGRCAQHEAACEAS